MTKVTRKMSLLFSKLRAWLRIRIVFSKTIVCIWGLIFCYGFIQIGVVGVLMDYFSSELFEDNLRKAAIMTNVKDGLSSIFRVVTHILESYVGRFNVIILCTSSSVIGLMLLWASSDHLFSSKIISPMALVYAAVILIALGEVMHSTLNDFLDYQLKQKVKQSIETTNSESQQNQDGEEERQQNGDHGFIWWYSAILAGSFIAAVWFAEIYLWSTQFNIAVVFMVVGCFWFYSGCLSYSFEKPNGSPLYKMYKVFKAALWKWKLRYPTSEKQYYGENLTEKDFYRKSSQIRLKPHVPSMWRWLDRAAVINCPLSDTNIERQVINGELCSVEEVREVKLVASMTHFALTLLPCSLVMAAGNTFFIEQASSLRNDNFVSVLLLLKFVIREHVVLLFESLKLEQQRITIVRIGIGIICAVLCCFTAWRVELYRLSVVYIPSVVEREKNLSTAILIPQYFLLGLTNGLACKGFEKFFCDHVPKSMWSLEDAFIEFVLGIGKFLTIPFVYFITAWFKDSINESHVDWYYFMLGILNIVGLVPYGYYFWNYAYKNGYGEDEESTTGEGNQEGQEPVDKAPVESGIPEESDAMTKTSTMELEEQSLMVSQQNPGSRLILRRSSSVRRDNAGSSPIPEF